MEWFQSNCAERSWKSQEEKISPLLLKTLTTEDRPKSMQIKLRPYQEELIDRTRTAYKKGKKAPLIVAPTGSGKTVMFSYLSKAVVEKGNTLLILAHRKELLDQISETLSNFGVGHSFIAPGYPFNPHSKVHVGSVFSVSRSLSKIKPPKIVVVDECHHATNSSTWGKVISGYPNAFILGVTATPCRLDGRPLGSIFDEIVMGPTVSQLIKIGALSDYRAFAPVQVDTSMLSTVAGDFNKAQLETLMDTTSITGNCVSEYLKRAPGKRAMVFCVSIKHAQNVAKEFNDRGVIAASVDGTMAKQFRSMIIREFREGKIQVLTSCSLVSEGFDLPAIEVGILLRPTKSLTLYLQQVGRVLRPFEGKPYAIILDHAGNIKRHGLPDEDREWSLNGKVKRKGDAPVKQCPECLGMMFISATVCPYCKYEFQVKGKKLEQVDGELREVDKEAIKRQRAKEQGSAKTLEDLIALGKARGYKSAHAWAKHVMNARGRK